MTSAGSAEQVMERCARLAGYSEEPGRLTRRFATEALREANAAVAAWMRDAGMAVRRDNVGNLIGRYAARDAARAAGARTLLLGSHLDTVRDAGRYDGPLGVLVALAAVERLAARGEYLPFAVEVIAFADEEGLRYHTAYLGSMAVAGTFDPAYLQLVDDDGVSLAEAIRRCGGDPNRLAEDARGRDELLGYCEVHIEQGPVLERHGLPVGVVSAIVGQSRVMVAFNGLAGHAGTVPMDMRRDALCAAAEFVLAVEERGRKEAGLVATVGQLTVQPGASNVIPAHVTLSLDVRHLDDVAREKTCRSLRKQAMHSGTKRGVSATWQPVQESPTVRCSSVLSSVLSRVIIDLGYGMSMYGRLGSKAMYVPSGAGHDAVALASLTPVAMLFVRCKDGISHSPDEAVAVEDVAVAIDVLDGFLARLAHLGAAG